MSDRTLPLNAFNFLVDFGPQGPNASEVLGGFSDVSGISTELTIGEYRNGNEPENHVRKVAGCHKVGDVTLKRGVVNSEDFMTWITEARTNSPNGKRAQVVITLNDESSVAKQRYILTNVYPLKWTGPTLAAKGGGEVAMEELTLSAEGLEIQTA